MRNVLKKYTCSETTYILLPIVERLLVESTGVVWWCYRLIHTSSIIRINTHTPTHTHIHTYRAKERSRKGMLINVYAILSNL